MNKMITSGKRLLIGVAAGASSLALTAGAALATYVPSEAATSAATALGQVKDDVGQTLGPALISVAVAVTLVLLAIGFIRRGRS